MDLNQRKLNKSEWDSIEVPVSEEELDILKMIREGYSNVNIRQNKWEPLIRFLKVESNQEMEDYLYTKYFSRRMDELVGKYDIDFLTIQVSSKPHIKKVDLIRLEKNTLEIVQKVTLYENILVETVEQIVKHKKKNDKKWMQSYYTLFQLMTNHITGLNEHIKKIVKDVLKKWEDDIEINYLVKNSIQCIEKNDCLLKYSDKLLYIHQKDIFALFKNREPKLVLYIAPTGTGKTLTPIGLSEGYRVIFVCAARHVGLALARAAISADKKIGFAFGCGNASDIRLHYFAAKDYTKNRKTGGIWKVDNSVGDKVEILICDIKSYLPAMYYMMAFNPVEDIITYWDEPTITMDYENHEFHEIIHKNWTENKIPNMVLSSATLPKVHELTDTIVDFKNRFEGSTLYSIVSHDCKKSIPCIDNNGFVVLPHFISREHSKLMEIVQHCDNMLTLLRYFDLAEIIGFIEFMEKHNYIGGSNKMERVFSSLEDINMKNIKLYYLRLLKSISQETWPFVYDALQEKRTKRIVPNEAIDNKGNKIIKSVSLGPGVVVETSTSTPSSGLVLGKPLIRQASEQISHTPKKALETGGNCAIFVTTKDAFTLTEGPTIFLAQDVEKIAKFCIQQANIPGQLMEEITEKLNFNTTINEKIDRIEKDLEAIAEKKENDTNHFESKGSGGKREGKIKEDETLYKNNAKKWQELEMLRTLVKIVKLNDTFVPNTLAHVNKWAEDIVSKTQKKPFTCDIDDTIMEKIMLLNNVQDSWKVLLLMGIGVFTNHDNIEYTEIMKTLADQQKLYLIIASSDYIYGTNYQFCHGYLSKDMNLTQEKTIQAMGRIGRNNIQQDYTIRLRDPEQINKIFYEEKNKPEVLNMNRLFSS